MLILKPFLIKKCFKLSKNFAQVFFSTKVPDTLKSFDDLLTEDREYQEISEPFLKVSRSHTCYVIQPYIKWGPQKLRDISVNEQLDEAKALIHTLPKWTVKDTITIPLENFDKKFLFGTGTLEKLRNIISRQSNVDLIYINLSILKNFQLINLENVFKIPIWDRYRIVMQILKEHAQTKHAKLQVALAELFYIQRTAIHDVLLRNFGSEKIKLMFQNRELKLKKAITDLRMQRSLMRNKRTKNEYPVIAVIGYTNAGKTCLIKALTNEDSLKPKDQLFATLDVTVHSGILPSGLQVLFVDTVGFISEIPTNLIECFVATLEDAILADVILHVEDISSACYDYKRKHVLKTLENLAVEAGSADIFRKIISIGNKCDLVSGDQDVGILKVSAQQGIAIDALRLKLEDAVITNTNRQKIKIRLSNGGDEIRWLYKYSTVVSEIGDPEDSEKIVANVIITEARLKQFKHFIKNL